MGIVEQTAGEIYRTLWWCQRLWSHPLGAHQALTIKLDKWASDCILFAKLPWLEGTCSNELSCDIWSFPALCQCVFVLPFFWLFSTSLASNSSPIKEGGLLLDKTANHFFLFCKRRGKRLSKKNWDCAKKSNMMFTPVRFAKSFGHWWGHQPAQGEVGGWHICSCEGVHVLNRTPATPFACPHCGAQSHISPDHKQKLGFGVCHFSLNI